MNLKVDIEMDGKMLNSHGVDFLDGPLGLDLDEKDLDEEETRRDMAKILKELKQKHPDKEVGSKFSVFHMKCDVKNKLCVVFFLYRKQYHKIKQFHTFFLLALTHQLW